jgi:glucose/arabinose dehydrogenase
MRSLAIPTVLVLSVPAAPCQEAAPVPRFALVDAFPEQELFLRPLLAVPDALDDSSVWVVEQNGRVLRVPRDGSSDYRDVVVDLRNAILHPQNGGHNEEGLLGLAFDPRHAETGDVFLYYSHKIGGRSAADLTRQSRVSRFRVGRDGDGPPRIDPESELVVLEVPQPWGNHNGGTIEFGPDGMLYIALGDGGAADDRGGNGQNKGTLLGSILRIDVRLASASQPYRVPDDNPFVGEEGARPEIWAYGLRNPWRISFDRETGELWCGDVGQNLWEEVDRIVKGGNYGWPLMEATHAFPPGRSADGDPKNLIAPLAEYPRKDGISITGGHVYRGAKLPALRGRFVYGDFATRTIWACREDPRGVNRDVLELCTAPGPIASFGEERDGELLVLCFDGHVYRLVAAP